MSDELVEVVRSGRRESVHRGSVVLLGPDAAVLHAIGEVAAPMFPRSANKPIQALAMLRAGLDLDDAELALVCASHNGEPAHVEGTLRILRRHRLAESDLRCPVALPRHAETARVSQPRRAFMNCSAKHAGMLACCVRRGWPIDTYLEPTHPVQQAIAETLAEVAGEPVAATGVDGCGAPTHAISLTGLATAFSRLATGPAGSPQRRIADAMLAHPFLVAGTGREDTSLMRALPGLICKGGAEGVHAGALPDGCAVALKIEDGASRARLPVMVGALRALGVTELGLTELAEAPILGGDHVIGSVRLLKKALPDPGSLGRTR